MKHNILITTYIASQQGTSIHTTVLEYSNLDYANKAYELLVKNSFNTTISGFNNGNIAFHTNRMIEKLYE